MIINESVQDILYNYYYESYWGFIVCKLGSNKDYYQLSYSHEIIDKNIYIPTRHYTEKKSWSENNAWALGMPINPNISPVNTNWNESTIDNSPMFSSNFSKQTTADRFGWFKDNKNSFNFETPKSQNKFNNISEDWNHDIYLFNINSNNDLKQMNNYKYQLDENIFIKFNKLNFFDFNLSNVHFEKIQIDSVNKNIDIIIKI